MEFHDLMDIFSFHVEYHWARSARLGRLDTSHRTSSVIIEAYMLDEFCPNLNQLLQFFSGGVLHSG